MYSRGFLKPCSFCNYDEKLIKVWKVGNQSFANSISLHPLLRPPSQFCPSYTHSEISIRKQKRKQQPAGNYRDRTSKTDSFTTRRLKIRFASHVFCFSLQSITGPSPTASGKTKPFGRAANAAHRFIHRLPGRRCRPSAEPRRDTAAAPGRRPDLRGGKEERPFPAPAARSGGEPAARPAGRMAPAGRGPFVAEPVPRRRGRRGGLARQLWRAGAV